MTDTEKLVELSESLYEYLMDKELNAADAMSCAALVQAKICTLAVKNKDSKKERAELVKDIEDSFSKQTDAIIEYLNGLIE